MSKTTGKKQPTKLDKEIDAVPHDERARRWEYAERINFDIRDVLDEMVIAEGRKKELAGRVRDEQTRIDELTGKRDGLYRELRLVLDGKQETLFPPPGPAPAKQTNGGDEPGKATRGAAVDREKRKLAEEIDKRLEKHARIFEADDPTYDKALTGVTSLLVGRNVTLQDIAAFSLEDASSSRKKLEEVGDDDLLAAADKGIAGEPYFTKREGDPDFDAAAGLPGAEAAPRTLPDAGEHADHANIGAGGGDEGDSGETPWARRNKARAAGEAQDDNAPGDVVPLAEAMGDKPKLTNVRYLRGKKPGAKKPAAKAAKKKGGKK
jgi:hypothetical protein